MRPPKRRGGRTVPAAWQPLRKYPRHVPDATLLAADSDPEVRAALERTALDELWSNDKYTVTVRRREGEGWVEYLSIRRNDRKAARDWRDFQRIKNQLAGEETEAFELYPATSRVVDTANHYWLWCMPPGTQLPVGFADRSVDGTMDPRLPDSRQRPFENGEDI